jgi:hypothetical protein
MVMISKNNDIVVSKETNEYLDRIEEEKKRKIDEEQRRWYEMKLKMLGPEMMKQEYPSTAKEAFESANEGVYYGFQLAKLRANGSVCRVPYDDSNVVHTAWDIGLDDFTSIWCFQVGRGGQVSIINYYENWDEGAAHYCDWLNKQKYRFGRHIFPHDARKREAGSKTQYLDYVTPLLEGKFVVLDIKECDKLEGIQTVRSMLSRCVFDEEKTSKGFKHLEAYKKVWDDRLGCYKNTPLHDEHSHACFIGNTKIKTPRGDIAIKDISIDDFVITPNGNKKVINKYVRSVDELQFVKYKQKAVFTTPQHEFFCRNGLKCADSLSYNDELYTYEDLEECRQIFGLKSCKQNIGFKASFLSQKMKNPLFLMVTNTEKHVVESVTLSFQEQQEVYDLEIEDDHCYYANGFLVSNSDAFRYLAVGLKAIERRDSKNPEDDIKAINKYFGR